MCRVLSVFVPNSSHIYVISRKQPLMIAITKQHILKKILVNNVKVLWENCHWRSSPKDQDHSV